MEQNTKKSLETIDKLAVQMRPKSGVITFNRPTSQHAIQFEEFLMKTFSESSYEISSISDSCLVQIAHYLLSKLEPLQDLNDSNVLDLVNALEIVNWEFQNRKSDEIFADSVIEIGFCDSFKRLLEKHFFAALQNEDLEMITAFMSLIRIFLSCSYYSKSLCKKITENSLIKTYLRFLKREDLLNENIIQRNMFITELVYSLIKTLCNTVHLNKVEGSKDLLRQMDGVIILQKYRLSNNRMISFIALVIQSYLVVYEFENESLNTDISTFNFILQILETALSGCLFLDGSIFSPEEVLDALNILAFSDANKLMLVEAGVLNYYFDVLKGKYKVSDVAVGMAAHGMWMLSFNCGDSITKFPGYMEVLESAKNHSCENVKEKINGIIFEIEPRQEIQLKEHHIFISYQRDAQATILKVNDYLKSKGFKTWIDEEDMSGSVLDSMAIAVEKAYVVLFCISEKYKDSPNCRAEAEYAFRLQKRIIPLRLQEKYYPDGWLGFLVGCKQVLDFSQPTKFDISIKSLLKNLEAFKEEALQARSTSYKAPSIHEVNNNVKNWSKNDVMYS